MRCGSRSRTRAVMACPLRSRNGGCPSMRCGFNPLGLKPRLYPRGREFFSKDRAADSTEGRTMPGFRLDVDLETGIYRTAERYAGQTGCRAVSKPRTD